MSLAIESVSNGLWDNRAGKVLKRQRGGNASAMPVVKGLAATRRKWPKASML